MLAGFTGTSSVVISRHRARIHEPRRAAAHTIPWRLTRLDSARELIEVMSKTLPDHLTKAGLLAQRLSRRRARLRPTSPPGREPLACRRDSPRARLRRRPARTRPRRRPA